MSQQMRAPSPFSAFLTSVPRVDTVDHRILLDRLMDGYGVNDDDDDVNELYFEVQKMKHLKWPQITFKVADNCTRLKSSLVQQKPKRLPTLLYGDKSKPVKLLLSV